MEYAILFLSILIIFPDSAITALLCLVLLFIFFILLIVGMNEFISDHFLLFIAIDRIIFSKYLLIYTGAILTLFIINHYIFYTIINLLNFKIKC